MTQAVQLALERHLGGGPMTLEEQLGMEGAGWDGDFDKMRSNRLSSSAEAQDSTATVT